MPHKIKPAIYRPGIGRGNGLVVEWLQRYHSNHATHARITMVDLSKKWPLENIGLEKRWKVYDPNFISEIG